MNRKLMTREQLLERQMEVAEMVQSGISVRDTAEKLNVSIPSVYAACKDFGVRLKRGAPSMPTRKSEKWKSVDWSMRNADIAAELNLTGERVRQMRKKLKQTKAINHRRRIGFIAFRRWADPIIEKLASMSIYDIAVQCGLDQSSVKRWCNNLGIATLPDDNRPLRDRITKETFPLMVQKKVVRGGMGECWEWSQANSRYQTIGGSPAHHFIFEMYHGERMPGLWILHKCDNAKCLNPDHLYAGSAKENAADRAANNPDWHELISDEDVREIRRRHLRGAGKGADSIGSLAVEFGICYQTAWKIVRRTTRADAGGPENDPPGLFSLTAPSSVLRID